MSTRQTNPSTWDEYERGGSPDRAGSLSTSDGRHIAFEDNDYLGQSLRDGAEGSEGYQTLRRRR